MADNHSHKANFMITSIGRRKAQISVAQDTTTEAIEIRGNSASHNYFRIKGRGRIVLLCGFYLFLCHSYLF